MVNKILLQTCDHYGVLFIRRYSRFIRRYSSVVYLLQQKIIIVLIKLTDGWLVKWGLLAYGVLLETCCTNLDTKKINL